MTTKTKDLERQYGRKVAEVRRANSLSQEKKELAVQQLGLKYDRARKQEEEAA